MQAKANQLLPVVHDAGNAGLTWQPRKGVILGNKKPCQSSNSAGFSNTGDIIMPNSNKQVKWQLDKSLDCDLYLNQKSKQANGLVAISNDKLSVIIEFVADLETEIIAGETCDGLVVWGSSCELDEISELKFTSLQAYELGDDEIDYKPSSDDISSYKEIISDFIAETAKFDRPNVYINCNGAY